MENSMNYEDFIRPSAVSETEASQTEENAPLESVEQEVELDVQKAVVESLAADKAEQNVIIEKLQSENKKLASTVTDLQDEVAQLKGELQKMGDLLARNSEQPISNQVTLLERNIEMEDRFEGETRDQILEVLKEAREESEKAGRIRRAQLLESVLVHNVPCGELAKRREQLEKLFVDNQNVINGQVINELDKMNITYKIGEKYLLVGEIIKRAY